MTSTTESTAGQSEESAAEKIRAEIEAAKKIKNIRKFLTFLLTLSYFLSSCAPEDVSVEAIGQTLDPTVTLPSTKIPDITETPLPTVDWTATSVPTDIPTKTATPTETATPEMKAPVADFDWDEFITSLPILASSKEYLKRDIETQFDDGGLRESDGAHVLRCITRGEMIIYDSGEGGVDDQPLVLPTGHEIPATFRCSFVIKTASGELVETEVQIAPYVYHPNELTHKVLGYGVKLDSSEKMIASNKKGLAQKWAGVIGGLERSAVGLAHPNQVILLDLAIPEGAEFNPSSSGQGYLNETMQAMYDQGQLDEFFQTGVWPFVFETPEGELINLVLSINVDTVDHLYP